MNGNEKNIKIMLEMGKKIFKERGLKEELDLYCHYYVESGPKPQSILFLSLFPDKSGWISLTDTHVTIIPEETSAFKTKLLAPIKIPYDNIASFNCKKGILLFKDGTYYKMKFDPVYNHFVDRIINKFEEKEVTILR